VVRWTSARGMVIDDGHGHPARMIGVGIDVSHLKQLEEELRLQHHRKDEFLAMLGHELRNPLAAINHAVELLSSGSAEEIEAVRQVIRRQSLNLGRLVDDLLDVSRITRGHVALTRRTVSLSEVVNGGVEVWRHLINEKRQQLIMNVPPNAHWLDGDATRLTQVFANLIHNAAKFTPEDGTITVTAREEDGSVLLSVRDDGPGMTPEMLKQAFELFVQESPTLDRQQGGLGLGLTLVRRLVEMHGGTVEARSGDGLGGTEIIVRLPLTAPDDVAPKVVAPAAAQSARPRRVLVVEDNPDVRTMLVYLLKRDGHEVRAVGDGPEALTAAEEFLPEIVLLDLGLPGMDGYEVARRLRASSRTAEALLVALTGYGQAEDREKAYAAGFDQHLLKPAEPAEVRELIRKGRVKIELADA
jgi:CheY-like chemotaxis protein